MLKKHLSIIILTSIIILLFISCGLNNPFLPTNLIKHDSNSTPIPSYNYFAYVTNFILIIFQYILSI